MSDEVVKYVESLAEVKTVEKTVSINGKLVRSVVRHVAHVVTREGRRAIAVDAIRSKDGEINQVICRYVEAADRDVVGQRCIRDGEQRQHYPADLTVIGDVEVAEKETN